jgi:signal transduction histidine kinase
MSREIESVSSEINNGTARAAAVFARVNENALGRSQNTWQEPADRERSLRMEERVKERARIARELHDTLLQGFLGASLQLHDAVEQVPSDLPSRHLLTRVLGLIQRVIEEGREVLQGLRSTTVATMNIEHALSTVRDEFRASETARLRIYVKGRSRTLEPAIQEQIYLIGREALLNAMRHSQATDIEAEVEYRPRGLRVVVRDNGCGMDPEVVRSGRAAHWGLLGMRERAEGIGARLRIWSRQGAGTEVEISVLGGVLANACA